MNKNLQINIKKFLIAQNILKPEDFYLEENIQYLPQKTILKSKINFNQTFDQDIIAENIAFAHTQDQSFSKIIQACHQAICQQEYACLMVFASGSGQLVRQLLQQLSNVEKQKIANKIYGIDISSTMAAYTQEHLNGCYTAIVADCLSFTDMQSKIPELSEDKPILVISHGGLRYFANSISQQTQLLTSFAFFPKQSKLLLSESGYEFYPLLDNIKQIAYTIKNIKLNKFPENDQDKQDYSCANLTYYYFLMQLYYQSESFQIFINNLNYKAEDLHRLLLTVAGQRQQAVYFLDLKINP